MTDKPPYLTLVDGSTSSQSNDDEFIPLPCYSWDERPATLPLDYEECATALHLAQGDEVEAARLLRVPTHRLKRMVRASPRLQRVFDESMGINVAKARSVIIKTLWDPHADNRRLEWAATKLLQSRVAQGDPLSPAPAANMTSALPSPGKVIISWLDEPDPDGSAGPTDAGSVSS